ncbi:hypothetical protein WN943_025027 [Citrus x changshan-huyou]
MQKFGAFQSQKLSQINIINNNAGDIYAKKLSNFVEKQLKSERIASVTFIHKYSRLNFEYRSSAGVWGRVLILPTALDGDGNEVNEGSDGDEVNEGNEGRDEVKEVLLFPNELRGLNKSGERVAEEGGDLAG